MTQREIFEAWARSEGVDVRRFGDRPYHNHVAQNAWVTWQAAQAAQPVQIGWQPIESAPKDGQQ